MQIQLLTSFLRIDTLLDLLSRCFQASVFNAYQHILLLIRIHSCFNLDNLIIQEMSDFQGCQCGKCTMSIFDVATTNRKVQVL